MTIDPGRLDALRARIGGIKITGGGGNYWKPKAGKNIIRILPSPLEDGLFFAEVGKHFSPDRKTSWTCPNFTLSAGNPCPICELSDKLSKSASKADKKLSEELRLSKAFYMWIIDRDNEEAGPQLFNPGPMIFSKIAAYVNDVDYGDLSDPSDGFDVTITKTGEGMDTSYDVVPRRQPSPATKNPDTFEDWLRIMNEGCGGTPDNPKDLSTSQYVKMPTADEILEQISSLLEGGRHEEEPEEEQPKQNSAASARSALQKPAATPTGNSAQPAQQSGGLKRTVLRR